MTKPECDRFPVGSFHRRVCEGEAQTLEYCNAHRARWGLPPLQHKANVVATGREAAEKQVTKSRLPPTPEPVLGRYPGTNLALLLQKCGVAVKTGCGCEEWIGKMNAWGVDGCVEHRQEIIDRLANQAQSLIAKKELSMGKIVWTGLLMMWNGIWPDIEHLVDAAIDVARKTD